VYDMQEILCVSSNLQSHPEAGHTPDHYDIKILPESAHCVKGRPYTHDTRNTFAKVLVDLNTEKSLLQIQIKHLTHKTKNYIIKAKPHIKAGEADAAAI